MSSHRVPFSSQYTDLGQRQWRARGCGITALKMVMDFWHQQNTANRSAALEEVLSEGLRTGAYRPGIGWSHGGLVAVARGYGYAGFNVDVAQKSPTPRSPMQAWDMVTRELQQGPLLVSVHSGFDPQRPGGHIVVLTGIEGELVLFNDPEEMSAREGCKILAHEKFMPAFKRRYIVIRPA